MTFGSLFAGIGGFDLGLERAGMVPVFQVESNPFCRRVLAKHWPQVKRYDDVRTVHGHRACLDGRCNRCLPDVDLLCGGFPCQDISDAGRRGGIDGSRSGLWAEFARLICELRPRYVFVENVSALLVRGLGRILGDLAASGYDAEWNCIPAAAVGAPHLRDRVWLIAYVPDPDDGGESARAFDDDARLSLSAFAEAHEWWRSEPDVDRVADGIPHRSQRLRALGNAIVPQIAEWIGRRIVATEVGSSRLARKL